MNWETLKDRADQRGADDPLRAIDSFFEARFYEKQEIKLAAEPLTATAVVARNFLSILFNGAARSCGIDATRDGTKYTRDVGPLFLLQEADNGNLGDEVYLARVFAEYQDGSGFRNHGAEIFRGRRITEQEARDWTRNRENDGLRLERGTDDSWVLISAPLAVEITPIIRPEELAGMRASEALPILESAKRELESITETINDVIRPAVSGAHNPFNLDEKELERLDRYADEAVELLIPVPG